MNLFELRQRVQNAILKLGITFFFFFYIYRLYENRYIPKMARTMRYGILGQNFTPVNVTLLIYRPDHPLQ